MQVNRRVHGASLVYIKQKVAKSCPALPVPLGLFRIPFICQLVREAIGRVFELRKRGPDELTVRRKKSFSADDITKVIKVC